MAELRESAIITEQARGSAMGPPLGTARFPERITSDKESSGGCSDLSGITEGNRIGQEPLC